MNALERQREWDKVYLATCRNPRLYRALQAGAKDGTAHLPERTPEEVAAKERAAIRHAWVLLSAKRQEERSVTSGMTMYRAFSGIKKLLQEANRFSQKTLSTLTAPQDQINGLRDHVLSKLALGGRP